MIRNPHELAHEVFDPPLISVGVLSYKRPHLLCHALNSVASQTYQNLEVLISDNGSNDPEIRVLISSFAARFPNARVFLHEQNRGAFWNFRFVLEQARGPLFVWLADDDYWSPNYLEILAATRGRGRLSLSYSACAPISLETNQTGELVKERGSELRGVRNVLRQTLFDTDSIIYGLFDRSVGVKYAPLLHAWPILPYARKRLPTMEVDFVSYAFLYGLLLEVDFVNASQVGGMHFAISTPRSVAGRPSRGFVAGLLDLVFIFTNIVYLHFLLAVRFIRAAFIARSLPGVLFAPFAASYLFARRVGMAARSWAAKRKQS